MLRNGRAVAVENNSKIETIRVKRGKRVDDGETIRIKNAIYRVKNIIRKKIAISLEPGLTYLPTCLTILYVNVGIHYTRIRVNKTYLLYVLFICVRVHVLWYSLRYYYYYYARPIICRRRLQTAMYFIVRPFFSRAFDAKYRTDVCDNDWYTTSERVILYRVIYIYRFIFIQYFVSLFFIARRVRSCAEKPA